MQWLYFALIALCMTAAFACELCYWQTLAILLTVDVVGLILARRCIEIPRLSKFIAVLLWVVFIAFEVVNRPGIQLFFLNSFLDLVWAMLAYRALNHEKLTERLQVGILSLLPLACVAIKLQASTFLCFLFAYLILWTGFLANQSISSPSTGSIAVSQNQTRGLNAQFWLTASAILLFALIIGCGLFIIVPRYGSHSLSPVPSLEKTSGQFPDVSLDKTGAINLDPTLIFRAEVPPDYEGDNLYWRIDVQNAFNGVQWFSLGSQTHVQDTSKEDDTQFAPEDAYLLEFAHEWQDLRIPTLINTEHISHPENPDPQKPIHFLTDDTGIWRRQTWRHKSPITDIHYWMYAHNSIGQNRGSFSPRMIWPGRSKDEINARLTDLAKSIVGDADSNELKAIRIRDHLRQEYGYSLNRPQRTGYIVEDFLYRQPVGHCEVFSTTMAVLLARLNVPVRNVTGFVSNEFNDHKNYVRAAHAHSWVEVWLDNTRGWTVFDPTPSGAQTVHVDWRIRFDDWFSSYQTRDFYRWMQKNGLILLMVLIATAACLFALRWPIRFVKFRTMPVDELCQNVWDAFNDQIHPHSALKNKPLESWWSEDCSEQLKPAKELANRLIQIKYRPNTGKPVSWFERFKYNHETLRLASKASRAIKS